MEENLLTENSQENIIIEEYNLRMYKGVWVKILKLYPLQV